MSKKVTWILIVLFIVVVFLLIPLLLPSDEGNEYAEPQGYEENEDIDIDLKKKSVAKSARSVGGSKSFRSGK